MPVKIIKILFIGIHKISKHFYILMHQTEKQSIIGQSELIREDIVAACHETKIDDWNACANFFNE